MARMPGRKRRGALAVVPPARLGLGSVRRGAPVARDVVRRVGVAFRLFRSPPTDSCPEGLRVLLLGVVGISQSRTLPTTAVSR
jgi:hypothetical protein